MQTCLYEKCTVLSGSCSTTFSSISIICVSQLGGGCPGGCSKHPFSFACKVRLDLDHLGDQLVDFLSTGTSFSTFHEVKQLGLAGESSLRVGKLERPQEVVGLLEVGSDGVDLVDEVGGALNSGVSESLGDNSVGSDRDALLVDFSESTLVDKLLDGGTGRVSVCHVRFDQSEHSDGGLVQSNKGSVVELTKAEELHDLLGLRGDSDNTADADDQSKLGFGGDEESTVGLGLAAVVDGKLLGGLVLFVVLLGVSLELDGIGGGLFGGSRGGGGGSSGQLRLSGLLLKDGFRGLHRGN
mmetsp:Transcript_3436/g.8169  ORF Transcript_3436/g.8169 Transcript_3436/m.8169 type:complete len:297 (+) Transcript_3436:159-1049(+)